MKPDNSKRKRPATFDDLGLDIHLSIMWLVAISSARNLRLVLQLSKRFKDITKLPGFYKVCQFPEIPRVSWRAPSSYENEFLYLCRKAMNPEIFWRDMVVDIFQYRNFRRIDEFLPLISGHPYYPYCECIVKLLSPYQPHRFDGEKKLGEIRSTEQGRRNLGLWRLDLCRRVQDLSLGYLWQHGETLELYCADHPTPNWFEQNTIECRGCMANFEAQIYYDPAYLSTVLNTRL